jgi:microcompartment protein CcmL/EutN
MPGTAIGLIETRGLIGVIEAADVAAKAAGVEILGFEPIGGGLISVRFAGDLASVQAAVQAGAEAARRVSEVISHHVIPAPHADLAALLQSELAPPAASLAEPAARPSSSELADLSVVRLRQLARQTPGVRLKGRQISRADKNALIAELQRAWQEDLQPDSQTRSP